MLEIVEKFITISGEAPTMGEPIYIIRFSHCNINCSYCDTFQKDEVNELLSRDELINNIIEVTKDYPRLKVLFTGGEPLLNERQDDIISIATQLSNIDFYVETNGTIKIKNFSLPNLYYVVDWKAPSSLTEIRADFCLDNLKYMRAKTDIIKCVVASSDFDWLIDKIKTRDKVNPLIKLYISPQFNKISLKELASFILKNRLDINISIQLHKLIWGDEKEGI